MKDDVIHYASRSESEAIQFNAIHELSPVNICSNHPPIQVDAKINRQYCRIVNQSATDLDYIIDTDNISRVNAQNFNFKIFQCLKSSGCLPAGGIEYLEIVFQPLEEKTYELKLPITVNGGIPRLITIRGQGVLYENLKKNEEYLDRTLLDNFINYSYKLTSQPKSIASISKKTLSFGHVPIFATLRQIFVVTNKSKHDTITVSWIIPAVFSTNVISVTPQSKLLLPGQSQICKVIFTPDYLPRCYNFDLECRVVNQTRMVCYFLTQEAYKAAQEEKIEALKDFKSSTELIPQNMIQKSFRSLRGKVSTTEDKSIRKYKLLPSISSKKIRAKAGEYVTDGELPATHSLHVNIRAQSHEIEEFKANYGSIDLFYHEKKSGYSTTPSELKSSPLWQQQSLVKDIMMSLLSDAFNDEEVQSIPRKLKSDPALYFRHPNFEDDTNAEGVSKQEILRSADFINSAEAAIEGTIYNLMQEIEIGEFQCTTYPKLVLKQ